MVFTSNLETTSFSVFLFNHYDNKLHYKIIKSNVQVVQGERDWESLALHSYTLLNLVMKLRTAAVQKTQNGSGWQVVADLQFKNLAIKRKTVWQIETVHLTNWQLVCWKAVLPAN